MDILYYLALAAAVGVALWHFLRKPPAKGIDDWNDPRRGG